VAFASAPEFLAWLSAGRAACLVLDIHMDGTSGFELQERLSVPVIFITAHDDASIRARIAKSGAAGDLKKPFDARSLLDAISRVTKRAPMDQGPIGHPGHVGETECSDKEPQ
jgi:FixJ family two-component response regulator